MVEYKIIEKHILDAIIKCGRGNSPRESSGLIDEPPRYESDTPVPNNELLNKIADDMCERYGLEVSINSKGKREIGQTKFSLWDPEHNTLIRLDSMVKHPEYIDFTNNDHYENKEQYHYFHNKYTLDDVLNEYNNLNDNVKNNLGELIFDTRKGASYNEVYNPKDNIFNVVRISSIIYGSSGGDYTLKRILAHECGHAGEQVFTDEQRSVLRKAYNPKTKKYSRNFLTTQREINVYNDFIKNAPVYRNQMSYSKEYTDAMNKNKEQFASYYSKSYGLSHKGWIEDYAETMSAVAYRNVADKSGFKIRESNGKIVGYDEFVSNHQATFQFCCDVADGKIKHTDLHHPINGYSYNNRII